MHGSSIFNYQIFKKGLKIEPNCSTDMIICDLEVAELYVIC